MRKKIILAWECPFCGKQHMQQCERGNVPTTRTVVECTGGCGHMRSALFIRIGKRTWAAVLPYGARAAKPETVA